MLILTRGRGKSGLESMSHIGHQTVVTVVNSYIGNGTHKKSCKNAEKDALTGNLSDNIRNDFGRSSKVNPNLPRGYSS